MNRSQTASPDLDQSNVNGTSLHFLQFLQRVFAIFDHSHNHGILNAKIIFNEVSHNQGLTKGDILRCIRPRISMTHESMTLKCNATVIR